MRSIRHKILSFIGLLVTLSLLSGVYVHAEPSTDDSTVSISAVPSIIDMGGKAGSQVPFSVKITNHSRLVLPIHLTTRPMLGMEGETNSFLLTNDARQWVRFDNPDFLLAAGQTKAVTGSLIIPTDVGPAGYYADIVVRPLSLQEASGTVHAQPELTIRLLTRVSGKAIEQIDATTQGSRLVVTRRSSKEKIAFSLKNNGNVHELVRPVLHIARGGHDVFTKAADPILLLPREERQVSFDFPGNVGGGIYDTKLTYDYGTPLKHASSPAYRLIVMPFSPAWLLLIPVGLILFVIWRYHDRLQRALRILAKGDKAGN